MNVTVISPPAELPVSVEDARAYLQIGHDGEDLLVSDLVAAATARLEAASGLSLVARTLSRTIVKWPATLTGYGFILRPKPVSSLIRVDVLDADGVAEDMSSRFQLLSGRLVVRPWSVAPAIASGGSAKIVFGTGFGTAAAVPDDLKLAVLRLTAESYKTGRSNLGGDVGLPAEVVSTIEAHRELRV